jgi:plastocyanin
VNRGTVGRSASLAVILVVALSACSSNEAARPISKPDVRITGFLFKPETLSVTAGATVTWTNSDDIAHTVTAGTPGSPTGAFDSGDRTKVQTFEHPFSNPGTFAYFCRKHNGMRGEVRVT